MKKYTEDWYKMQQMVQEWFEAVDTVNRFLDFHEYLNDVEDLPIDKLWDDFEAWEAKNYSELKSKRKKNVNF